MSIFSKIKKWLTGDDSSSKNKSSNNNSRSSRASRVSNYGGGGSRSYRDNYSTGSARYKQRDDEEKRRRQEQKAKQQSTTNALASISKRTDALAKGRSSSVASSATHANAGKGTTRVLERISERSKATPPDPKEKARKNAQKSATEKLQKVSDDRKEFNKATGDKYNVAKNGTKARIAQKSQAYDVKAEKYETEKHPVATSLGRGAVSGVTFGASELMAKRSKNRQRSGAEKHYQRNKSAKAEMAGEIAGSLAGFGLTEGAATKVASKVAPKALKEGGASVAKSLAKNSAFRTAAKKEAERTGIKVTEEVIDRFASQRAQRLVNSIGQDMAVNLTTGAAMDVNQSLHDSMDENGNVDWRTFGREMGTNAALNLGLGGAVTVAPALRTSKGLFWKGARDDAMDLAWRIKGERDFERLGRRASSGTATNALAAPKIGESLDETIARRGRQTAERNAMEARPSVSAQMRQDFIRNADNADAALNRGFTIPENRIDVGSGRLPANQVDVGSLDNAVPRMADNSAVRARADEANARYRREFLDRAMQRGNASATDGRMRLEDITNIPDIAVARIDDELEALNREILQKRNTASDEELMALTDRFDRLMANRKALLNPETMEEKQLANALRKNAVAGRQARRGPEALSEAESARMRNAFTNNADEAERNLDRGFVLLDDARTAPTDSGATNINIRRLADERQAARDANRRNTLDGLFANARANEVPREPRQLSDLVNIRTADDAANQARLAEINEELDQVQREILLRRNTASPEELEVLNNRFSELLDERRAIETPPSLEQRRTALQEERDNLFAEYQTASADDSVSPLELQGMLDDMQEMDLELRDLDAQIARESSRAEAPRAEAPAPQTVEQPKQADKAQKAKAPKAKNKPKAETRVEPKTELPKAKGATEQAPNINEGNVPKAEASTVKVTPPEKGATKAEPKAELPQTEARKPRTKEEAIQMARESQTRKESEKLLRDYFDEYDEVDLGIYGQVSKNSDGTYTLSIDGAGEKNLSKKEVEERIKQSTKRAYDKPREVNDIKDTVYARNERPSFRERLKKAWGSGRTMIADSLSSFEDTERALAKAEHRQVDYGTINEVRAHQAKANRSISNRQLDYKGDKYSGTVKRVGADGKTYEIENGTSLVDIYKGMDEEVERDFDLYLTLRHAPDRLLQGKSIFENIVDSKGLNFDDPKVCIAEADRLLAEHPEFAKKAEQVYQYTQNELKNRVDAGLLSKKTMDEWNEMYPHYVPTGREGFNEIHGVNGPTVGASEIRGAKGSDRNVMSIRDQLSAATTRNWRDVSTNEMFKKYFGDKIASDLAKDADGGIERVLDNTINLGKKETGNSSKYYADVYIDGKKHTVELEERFYEGLKDLYKNGRTGNALFDTTNEAFSKVAGVWKNLITEWSPIFMVKNGMRDFPEAIINSRQSKEFIQCMNAARHDLATGGQFSEALKDAGISQSTFIDIDKALKAGKEKKSWLSRANEAIEMYPRLCEYMATLKKAGIDINDPDAIKKASRELKARAAANAADVTVNFGRSGSVGKMINKGLVPFFNPSIQGWSKFLRNVTERDLTTKEGIKDALSFIAKASALGAGANTINNFMLQDNPNYQQISARDKANNYIIPWAWGKDRTADNTDLFIKIPKSRFASAYGLPSVNAFNDNDMGWAEMLRVANDQVAPIDPLESTLFSPFLAAKNNETWYGTPIVSEGIKNESHPSEEYDANTSYIGRGLGKLTENLPKELQISPKKADYLIDAEFGVAADFALPALTPSRQGGGKGILGKAGPAILNVPKRAFTIDSTTQNDLSTRFYEQMQTAEDNKKSSKATDKDSAEYKRMNAYQKEVSTLTSAIRDLQAGDRATKQEDIRGLQEVRNKMMQDALDGKKPPSSAKAMDAVQKYVGTSYAIDKFGSSADKEAMKVYGASVYGNISEKEMQKKIDADKDFYKGVRAVGKMEDQLAKATGSKATSNLSKAVALASVGASDELFGAYEGTKKSRTETAIKMDRARNYISDGGSTKEFVKLEKARKTLGKLSDYDKEAELDNALAELKSGKINEAEYYQKQGEIKYNANISYVGLATSLAESNAPSRGYVLYDIKAKNVQKGINLAAMGFTARDYREMAKAVDADGNGYPKKQEIIDYVNSRTDIEDKATLYDALFYYNSSYNPFGAVTDYSREQAASNGKARGVEQISDEKGALKLKNDESSSKSSYRGYGRRRSFRRWRSYGGGGSGSAKVPKPKKIKASSLKAGKALVSKSSSSSAKAAAPKLERVKAKIDLPEAKW